VDAITYALSKKYTDNKITESAGLHREIVTSLPATGDDTTIYMVLDQTASSPDIYDEWLWTNGAYEHIGSTRVDLSDYYNKTQIDTALNDKANTSDIPTALSDLTADSTHRLVTDTEKTSWSGKADWTAVTIPVFTPSQAGWRRICKIKTPNAAGTGLIYVGGNWSNGAPASALLSVSTLHSIAYLTLLSSSSPSGIIKSIRLVYISPNQFWVDVYFPAYSSATGPHTLKFSGDIEISDIQNPIPITTDTTATAEISLTQTVSGVVLTGEPIKVQSLTIDVPAVSAGRGTVVYKALPVVSGYKAVGIIGMSCLGNMGTLSLNDFFVNNTEAYVSYNNNTSSATTKSAVTLDILYKKT
jgi:hypothetical protein